MSSELEEEIGAGTQTENIIVEGVEVRVDGNVSIQGNEKGQKRNWRGGWSWKEKNKPEN
jgi:hypothetical protein